MARNERVQDRSRYLSRDTIAAFATPLGGAIALLRLSGPRAFEALGRLAPEGWSEKHPEFRRTFRVLLRDLDGSLLDDAVVVRYEGPRSYTGEDSAEISLHGSPVIADRIFDALIQLGIRQALPGEFAFRAVRNGKATLAEAEATADLIASTNPEAATLALEKMGGAQNRLIQSIADDLRNIAVLSEAGIDFSDQDLEELSLSRLQERVVFVIRQLEALKNGYSRGARVQGGIRAAFVGLPNAGKSSFFNALLGEERSIVSEVAGTTRDVVREYLTLRGKRATVTLRMEDTAGLRVTTDRIEKIGIERTLQAAAAADLVLLIVDASESGEARRRSLEALEAQWNELNQPQDKALGVLTKIDLASDRGESLAKDLTVFGISRWCPTSAAKHEGIHETAEAVTEFCESWVHRDPGELLLTRIEHLRAVEAALEDLGRARNSVEMDLFAADLRQALQSLSPLIGDTLPDDILGRIFSDFCIGK